MSLHMVNINKTLTFFILCLFALFLILSAAFVFTGCSSLSSRAEVKYEANQTVGDTWKCAIASEDVVRLTSGKFRMFLPLPGFGGTYTFKFHAVAEGETEVVFTHYFRGNPTLIVNYSAVVDSRKNLTLTKKDSVALGTPDQIMAEEAAYERGEDAYNKMDYDAAITEFTEAIRLKPDCNDAYHLRGLSYYYTGNYDDAISDLVVVTGSVPNFAYGHFSLGLAYAEKGYFNLAIDEYSMAISLKYDDAIVYVNRALSYMNIGGYDRAIDDLNTALRINPDYELAKKQLDIAIKERGSQ